jgi:hypothetical protein
MWSQYASAVEGKGLGDKNCPVALGVDMDGYGKKTAYCSVFEVNTRITVPEDVKLVTSDGYVVSDEICVGDEFKIAKGASKGEFWEDGGDVDSPAIYWVDDVEALVKELVSKHRSSSPARVGGTKVSDGYVDSFAGVPVYNVNLKSTVSSTSILKEHYKIMGNLVCSVKGTADAQGKITQDGEYYKATQPGDATLNANYVVECIYYYYGGTCDPSSDMCAGTDSFCQYQVPMFPKMSGNSLEDLVKIGTISVKKNIKISQAVDAKAEFTIAGAEAAAVGEKINLRVLVKNTGTADMTITDISSKAAHKLVSCDAPTVAPGTETECILSVTPTTDTGLDVTVTYTYKSCGKTLTSQISKVVLGTAKITPTVEYQAYGIDVKGDCKNSYYSCDAPKDQLSVGYRCMKQQNYYTPSAGRADLEYDLSSLASDADIAVATLKIKPSIVNKPQKVGVYVYSLGLEPVSCHAGGDICTQPYCKECEPLYNIPGDAITSKEISSQQVYSFDVTQYVRKALSSGDKMIGFQLRGAENLWDTQGASQCGTEGYWTNQDVSFPASGADGPSLEIVIK